MKRRITILSSVTLILVLGGVYAAHAWTAVPVAEDPLVRMPGTQPGQTTLEGPNRCLNCHAGYDQAVEPGFNWMGSMMAQAARDPLFWACITVAGQDSIWAAGRPNAVDICERCHFPKGWLEGRSDPTNASAMTGADYDGVQCDLCHTMYDPFLETTYQGTREGADWSGYWDESNVSSTPSQPAADATYAEDTAQAQAIVKLDGTSFFTNNLPPVLYTENGSGQYYVSTGSQKRASFADAAARHQTYYSRYHKSKYFCDTCHDVSNPVLANLGLSDLNDDGTGLITEQYSAANYFHVERTFSEFMLSAYGQQGGAATNPEFQAQGAPDITNAAKCQDCHMRDVVGEAANKNGAVVRPNQSIEHPNSGLPLHDLTGGNVWVSSVLATIAPNSPNVDPVNVDLLVNQVDGPLTLDVTQGEGLEYAALMAGADRARQQLLLAATLKNVTYDGATGSLSFEIQNNTGHKLLSGFPEGRRMFVNVKAFDVDGNLLYEVNPYDTVAGTLKGLSYPYRAGMGLPSPQSLTGGEAYVDELVYETHPMSYLTGESESFHFALATARYKDNRIPPKGFDVAAAAERLSVPVWHGVEDPGYFNSDEYAGGYDDVSLGIAPGASYVEVNLYYQTTSREYVEFLRDEINGTGNQTLTGNGVGGDPAYLIQTDPFFGQLTGWGDTIWHLWVHNKDLDGAAPFLMASATDSTAQEPSCSLSAPGLLSATAGQTQVTLEWSAVDGATGYRVYYDQAGKAQLRADVGTSTTYVDSGLTNGMEYCYKVTAYDAGCESDYSSILCATPTNQGQAGALAGVAWIETGVYSGKGKSQVWQTQVDFAPGDTVTIRALVQDDAGNAISNATVGLTIGGPEITTLNSNPSDADGWAEASWNTKAPSRRQPGTAAGSYTASTSDVTASGYRWDGVTTSTAFTIQ